MIDLTAAVMAAAGVGLMDAAAEIFRVWDPLL